MKNDMTKQEMVDYLKGQYRDIVRTGNTAGDEIRAGFLFMLLNDMGLTTTKDSGEVYVEHIEAGDRVYTPRFGKVKIERVYDGWKAAADDGFEETTHYDGEWFNVVGKSIDMYHMEFAAYRK